MTEKKEKKIKYMKDKDVDKYFNNVYKYFEKEGDDADIEKKIVSTRIEQYHVQYQLNPDIINFIVEKINIFVNKPLPDESIYEDTSSIRLPGKIDKLNIDNKINMAAMILYLYQSKYQDDIQKGYEKWKGQNKGYMTNKEANEYINEVKDFLQENSGEYSDIKETTKLLENEYKKNPDILNFLVYEINKLVNKPSELESEDPEFSLIRLPKKIDKLNIQNKIFVISIVILVYLLHYDTPGALKVGYEKWKKKTSSDETSLVNDVIEIYHLTEEEQKEFKNAIKNDNYGCDTKMIEDRFNVKFGKDIILEDNQLRLAALCTILNNREEEKIISNLINQYKLNDQERKIYEENIKKNVFICLNKEIEETLDLRDVFEFNDKNRMKLSSLCSIIRDRNKLIYGKYPLFISETEKISGVGKVSEEKINSKSISEEIAKFLFTPFNKSSFIITVEKIGLDDINFIIAIFIDKIYVLDKSIPVMFNDEKKLNISGIVPPILTFENDGIKDEIISKIIKIRNSRENTIPAAPIRKVISERSNKIQKKFTKEELEYLEKGAPEKKTYFESDGGLRFLISKRPVSFMKEMCKVKKRKGGKAEEKKERKEENLYILKETDVGKLLFDHNIDLYTTVNKNWDEIRWKQERELIKDKQNAINYYRKYNIDITNIINDYELKDLIAGYIYLETLHKSLIIPDKFKVLNKQPYVIKTDKDVDKLLFNKQNINVRFGNIYDEWKSFKTKYFLKLDKYKNDAINYYSKYNIIFDMNSIGNDAQSNIIVTYLYLTSKHKDFVVPDEFIHKPIISNENTLYIPVIRYTGLYYSSTPTDQKYCGKFYYVEPESTVYLNLGLCYAFGSKVQAYITLRVMRDYSKLEEKDKTRTNYNIIYERYMADVAKMLLEDNDTKIKGLIIAWNNAIKDDISYSPIDDFYHQILSNFYMFLNSEDDIGLLPYLETTALYPIDKSPILNKNNMKQGLHDFLDQPLCKLARELGIDTIILQHEIGEYRAVSEVLDTRENSYDYLVQIEDNSPCWVPNLKYHTVWFLEYGLINEDGCCRDVERNEWGQLRFVSKK